MSKQKGVGKDGGHVGRGWKSVLEFRCCGRDVHVFDDKKGPGQRSSARCSKCGKKHSGTTTPVKQWR